MPENLKQPMPAAMQAYLTQLHQVIVPYLLAQGLSPMPSTHVKALANLTTAFVTGRTQYGKIIDTVLVTLSNFVVTTYHLGYLYRTTAHAK